MGAEAKRYLQEHSIPQLFEGLMTGLIYNRPNDPIQFLESSIAKVRQNPGLVLKWDSFVDPEARAAAENALKGGGGGMRKVAAGGEADQAKARINTAASASNAAKASSRDSSHPSRKNPSHNQQNGGRSRQNSHSAEKKAGGSPSSSAFRASGNSLAQAAQNAQIAPDAPIILFMGGPGGGKTRYAAQLQEQLRAEGLVHICMPDLVRTAIARYKDRMPEWRVAAERYQRGELIPNELAQQLVKAEMGKHPNARAYFLEGFPREARQVEDFERNVRPVNMALILDYDEEVLRRHMQSRGLLAEVIDRRINEFKQKTLPSAKYFDDQRLLHLIPGEKEDHVIIERMKKLALRAMRAGVHLAGGGSGVKKTTGERGNGGGGGTSTSASSSEGRNGAKEGNVVEGMNGGNGETIEANGELEGRQIEGEMKAETAPMEMANQREGTAGSRSSKITSKPNSAGTVKSVASSSAQKELAQESMRNNSASRKSRAETTTASNEKGVQNGGNAGSREGSGKSQQGGQGGMSSTVSTPKPSEGPFRELMADSSAQIAPTKSPAANSISTDSDTFPKGLPSEAPVILIIGAPGSNKSKFAQRVARKYDGFVYLGMGELFRRKVLQSGEDELWTRIGKKMDAGETIPSRICRDILYTALHERGQNGWGYVVEGYPRTLPQAEDIEAQLGRLDLAILIDCTEQFCRDALRRRKDKEEGTERADDDEGVVRVRLSLFKQNTLPMLKHLDDKGLLRVVRFEGAVVADMHKKIEGDSNEEKVFQEICSIIDNTLFIQDDGNGKSLGSSKQNSVDEIGDSSQQPPRENGQPEEKEDPQSSNNKSANQN